MTIELAVIGGTGVYALGELADVESHQPVTHYGAPSGPIRSGPDGAPYGVSMWRASSSSSAASR